MLRGLLSKVVGDSDQREIARLQKAVEQINALEPEFEALSDVQLQARTDEFRQRLADGEVWVKYQSFRPGISDKIAD